MFDTKQLSLVWQDYKKIFYISTVIVTAPIVITVVVQIWRGRDFVSFIVFEPLTWMLACAFLFLPIVFIMRFIVTRQLKKMIGQLEEEVEQKKAPVILYDVNEGKVSEGKK
ncbi:hypothetical protein [Bartonella sp. AU18XJBT]|uniref:hypothetical protein n=1 Tax=Bartonella sp. AU18XJBT TaxID=3019089 RepID=UPI002362EAFA|nr:hypothetical protein [Bartonella sp. AU18XJBT]